MINFNSNDTICALSTGNASAAIAVVRISGANAIKIVQKIFSKSLDEVQSHKAVYGNISGRDIDVLDEVLITLFRGDKSFTGEETVEIACHGSLFIKNELLNTLISLGCRMASPGEFTMRAYMNGKLDLSQAEAVADLIASNSIKSHKLAFDQLRGNYSKNIFDLKAKLTDFAALIELELDFSEEDVEFASRDELTKLLTNLKSQIKALLDSFAFGNAIKNGINTVIAGRPNAGKSTLLNALLNDDRAIVSDIAGTTRDTIEELITIDGVSFRLIDTAGIRDASDEIERIGVEKTFSEVKKSNILLYVFDASEISIDDLKDDLNDLRHPNLNILLLANKTDLINQSQIHDFINSFDEICLPIAAKNEMGIDEIKEQLVAIVNTFEDAVESDVVVVNARHFDAFSKAYMDIEKIELAMLNQLPGDLLAMDIRSAIRNLSSITGEISSDDVLGNIFANFCIGK